MGIYLYALRSPSLQRRIAVALFNGARCTLTAGSFSYLSKPSFWGRDNSSATDRTLARLESLLSHGVARPFCAVHTDCDDKQPHRIKVGQFVYIWPQSGYGTRKRRTLFPLSHLDGGDSPIPIGVVVDMAGDNSRALNRHAPVPATAAQDFNNYCHIWRERRQQRAIKCA